MNEHKSMKKLKFGHYYVIIFVSLLCFLLIRGCVIENDIQKSNIKVIAKFIKIEKSAKTTSFYFGFYYKEKYIETSASGVKHSMFNSREETDLVNNLKINHFYLAKFNPEHPKNIIVEKTEEVKDSLKIKDAGFLIN